MTPNRVAFRLSALGLGFHWSTEGTVPNWLELTPSQGDLADNIGQVAHLEEDARAIGGDRPYRR